MISPQRVYRLVVNNWTSYLMRDFRIFALTGDSMKASQCLVSSRINYSRIFAKMFRVRPEFISFHMLAIVYVSCIVYNFIVISVCRINVFQSSMIGNCFELSCSFRRVISFRLIHLKSDFRDINTSR